MRKLLPLAAIVVALASVAASGADGPAPVLGFDWAGKRLAWYDPSTLRVLSRRKVPLGGHHCGWAFSADRSRLAVSSCGDDVLDLRLIDTRTMRSLGDVGLGVTGYVAAVDWVRPDRLLVVGNLTHGSFVAVVDPQARRLLRTVRLARGLRLALRLPDGVALLLAPEGRFGPAQVAVVDAEGAMRRTTIDRISIGSIGGGQADPPVYRQRGAGFALDPERGRLFVVGADLLTAEVDVSTLGVTYHRPSGTQRSLQKAIQGPDRTAAWLGNGLLGLGGADYATKENSKGQVQMTAKPFGLRLLDTRDWSLRLVDPKVSWFRTVDGLLLATGEKLNLAYGFDGRERWRLALPDYSWLDAYGGLGYVCDSEWLRTVIDLQTGATLRSFPHSSNRRCAALLVGDGS